MLTALLRYDRRDRRAVAQEWAERSHAGWQPREADADTRRCRELNDARGQIVREGVTYFGDGRAVPWSVRRSARGRVDQLDVFAGGALWRTGGPRKVARWLGRLAR